MVDIELIRDIPEIQGYIGRSNKMLVLASPVLMADWDFADKLDQHYTVGNSLEVVKILAGRIKKHPEEVWHLYKTGGGIHAFCGSLFGLEEGCNILRSMNVDRLYIKFTRNRGKFAVRVEPKANRPEKQQFLGTIGKGETTPLVAKFLTLHDLLLRKHGLLD